MMALKQKLKKIKECNTIEKEVVHVLYNVKKYLNRETGFITLQAIIGFKILFKGYIIKDWHRNNKE